MMSEKFLSRASLMCGVSFFVLVCALAGCGRSESESPSASEPAQPSMSSPELKRRLRAQVSEREVLVQAQQVIIRKMEEVAARHKGDLKAAANDPEMVSLIRRARDLEANMSSNRAHTAEMIRASVPPRTARKEHLKKEVNQ